MATAEDPTGGAKEQAATAAIQGAAGAAPEAPIPLPPLAPPAPGAGRPPRSLPALDNALLGVVVLLAFLSALFPAYNSDFFQHAAAGRLIAQGQFPFGADPFTSTAAGEHWVNHSWLFDLFVYEVYRYGEAGGRVLVVLKALLVALMAALMLGVARRPGVSAWVPACCVGLAVLAVSSRAFLQPACLSFVLLALTLWLLRRPRQLRARADSDAPPSYLPLWLLPPLFALWVNLDAWFLLGPLTVGLYLLGEYLHEVAGPARPDEDRPAPGELRALGLVLVVGLAACLLNPYHVYAFQLPPHLLPASAGAALSHDAEFRRLYLMPWEGAYFSKGIGLSAAGLAYFPLLGLGLASFALVAPAVRWWRVLLWAAFAALSAFHARAIPFFAVVAGPITALNFLDFTAARWGTAPRFEGGWRGWAVAGRAMSVLLGVLLLVAAWPGWPQAQPFRYRRVGWDVHVDPSLQQAALEIQKWREQGLVGPDDLLFHTAPDVTYYLAWFCPGQRGFIDHRLPLFAAAGEDFVKARKALSGEDVLERKATPDAPGQSRQEAPGWQDVFRRHKVRWVVHHVPDSYANRSTLVQVLGRPAEFPVCYYRGRTAVFGWRDPKGDPQAPDPYAPLRMDFGRLAFGPGARPAPPQGPGREPAPHEWWMDLWKPAPGHSPGSDSAVLHSTRFDAQSRLWMKRSADSWQCLIFADAVGLAGLPGGALTNGALLPFRMLLAYHRRPGEAPELLAPMDQRSQGLLGDYVRTQDAGPPSALYLAVRAARRGLADNPDDGRAWLVLGQAYTDLTYRTREGARGRAVPHVYLIRQTQIAAALHRALKLKPTLEEQQHLHLRLVSFYRDQQFFEPAARHYREYLNCTRELGPAAGQEQAFNDQLDKLEKDVKALERDIKNRQDQYEVQAANKPVLQKVVIAMQMGLADTALNVLLKADPKDLHARPGSAQMAGATLEVNLLLSLGRVEEVRDALSAIEPEKQGIFGTNPAVGVPAFQWAQVQMAAADGDYEAADKHLAEILEHVGQDGSTSEMMRLLGLLQPREGAPPLSLGEMLGLSVGQLVLELAPAAAGNLWQIRRVPPAYGQFSQTTGLARGLLERQADLRTVRGWLALEAGRLDDARRELEAALAAGRAPGDRPDAPLRAYFRSTHLAAECLERLRSNAK
jgi:tetratricopeptide (TPR) repeat protein